MVAECRGAGPDFPRKLRRLNIGPHTAQKMSAKSWHRLAVECELWQKGINRIAGVDEAGRGPLAGPVVAAAVMLPRHWGAGAFDERLRDLNDSKQLTENQREEFHAILTAHPEVHFSIASVDAAVIDHINILQATHRAMDEALARLQPPPEHVLVDGPPVSTLTFPQTALLQGDARSYTIAAASVLAKVTRDRLMLGFDARYPGYGFAEHKGYGTAQHLAAIAKLGPCPIHRRSFSPFKPTQSMLF